MATMEKCVHKGCEQMFTPGDETASCVYHPGPPIFHEGQKGWKCCKPRVLTFEEFLSIPPCTTGTHSAVDDTVDPAAVEQAKQDAATRAAAVIEAATAAESQRKRMPIPDRFANAVPGLSRSSTPGATGATGVVGVVGEIPAGSTKAVEEDVETDTDDDEVGVKPGKSCRRRGCGKTSTGVDPTTTTSTTATTEKKKTSGQTRKDDEGGCTFHPGVPIFHEGSKGWSCCKRRVLEFDQFVKIEGCANRERHLFVGSGKTKAEKRAEAGKKGGEGDDDEVEDLIGVVRHDMYQSSSTLTVSFYLKNVVPEKSSVLFHPPSPSSSSSSPSAPSSSSVLHLDLHTDPIGQVPARHVRSTIDLFAPIVPARSSFEIRKTKVELILYKDGSDSAGGEGALGWPGLTADSASSGEILQVGSAGRA